MINSSYDVPSKSCFIGNIYFVTLLFWKSPQKILLNVSKFALNREYYTKKPCTHESGFPSLKILGQKIYSQSYGTQIFTLMCRNLQNFLRILIVCMCPRPALYVVGGGAGSCILKFNQAGYKAGPKEPKIAFDFLFLST